MTSNSSGASTPVIRLEQWGRRTAVVVLPRRVDRPSRVFTHSDEAVAFAEDLSRQHGWPVEIPS